MDDDGNNDDKSVNDINDGEDKMEHNMEKGEDCNLDQKEDDVEDVVSKNMRKRE